MIEVGKTYDTKNGGYAKVLGDYSDFDHVKPIRADVFDKDGSFDRIAFYSLSGMYNPPHKTGYDLVFKS